MPTFAIFIVDFIVIAVIISSLISAKYKKPQPQAPASPKTHINGRRVSDYSFKFNTPNGNSHQDQVNYQHEYSLKETFDPQKYQEIRERRELARIVDPPLSEAERNVLGYRIKENR